MVTALIGLALKAGVSKRFAKPVVYLALALLVLAVLAGAKCAYDASVIDRHETKRENTELKQTIRRERDANAEDAKIEQRNNERVITIEREIVRAVETYPEEASASAGPVTQSVLDELRRQGEGEQRGE